MHFILTDESGRLQHVPGMRASGFFEDSEGWYLSNLKYVEGERNGEATRSCPQELKHILEKIYK